MASQLGGFCQVWSGLGLGNFNFTPRADFYKEDR